MHYILDLPKAPGTCNLSRTKVWFDPTDRVFHLDAGESSLEAQPNDENGLKLMASCFKGNLACPGLLSRVQVDQLATALINLGKVYGGVVTFYDDFE